MTTLLHAPFYFLIIDLLTNNGCTGTASAIAGVALVAVGSALFVHRRRKMAGFTKVVDAEAEVAQPEATEKTALLV